MADPLHTSTLHMAAQAIAGDRVALDTLWRDHRRFAASVLLAHLPPAADLQDLLQDVATRMVGQIRTLKTPAAFRTWLRTIARNVAISAARKDKVRRCHTALPELDLPDPRQAEAEGREPAREQLDRIMSIVTGLHVDYREPLVMRCVRGMSQADIATALGLPVTTIETRLARARRLLRREMQHQPAIEPRP